MYLLLYRIFLYTEESSNVNPQYKVRLPTFAFITMSKTVVIQARNMILVLLIITLESFQNKNDTRFC